MLDIFLICPVRGVTNSENKLISKYVHYLEANGKEVYWPYRDTDQDDPIGNRICADNVLAMRQSKEVHVWYTASSTGTLFDLGAAFAMQKPIVIANRDSIEPTEGKSFSNVLLWWAGVLQ